MVQSGVSETLAFSGRKKSQNMEGGKRGQILGVEKWPYSGLVPGFCQKLCGFGVGVGSSLVVGLECCFGG